jgi:hypothetical protein
MRSEPVSELRAEKNIATFNAVASTSPIHRIALNVGFGISFLTSYAIPLTFSLDCFLTGPGRF